MLRSFGTLQKPLVSVLIATIPERAHFLEEAKASVRAQTFKDWELLSLEDTGYEGCSKTINRLAAKAYGEWLAFLADDDVYLPGFLKEHLAVSDDADIVYGPPLMDDPGPQYTEGEPPYLPATCMIRRSLFNRLGGLDESLSRTEDLNLYQRAMKVGARFVRVDKYLWYYRFHGDNKSRKHP